ncbi:MAG: phenylalanine--tRNA ligase subunit beta, partial [Pseudomonadota bacterium]
MGQEKPAQIVCGATNHKQGDFVAVATVGAVLPGDFKIKKSKIRGVESFGMLCSEKELGLSEEADGILILDDGVFAGQTFQEAYGQADIIFELNVTPNRADCLSHIGLARELATLLDRPVNLPQAKTPESGKSIHEWIQVDLKDSESCPRFCGRMISGVKVGESPAWLKNALESICLNSVNNVVDVTNYVLFEYGQPLHAYDYGQLKNSKIIVEKAKKDELFVSLDGTEIKLDDQDLVIRDGVRPVGIAGVIGGQNTGVSESTADIFLEGAFFKAEGVRKTSRSHGIETDACYRFSRGVDPEQTLNALNRAASLIVEVAGGELQPGDIDLYPEPLKFNDIEIKTDYVSQRLGFEVKDSEFEKWMQRLGCVVSKSKDNFRVSPPTYRWDLHIKEDLVEEFARLHGYDSIEEKLPVLMDSPTSHTPLFDFSNRVTQLLIGFGVHQCVNYAFIGKEQNQKFWTTSATAEKLGLKMGETPIELLNPLSEELSVMRQSLIPSLFKNIVFNDHHGNHFGRLFEIAPAHYKKGDKFEEQNRLALAFWGQPEGLWETKKSDQVVYKLKSTVESFLK